jgi:predicted ATPase/DNA-binding SARP family transcriptional activator
VAVEIRLLGPFELVVDGRSRSVPGAGERALLALLALSPGRVVSTDRLIDALWGEALPANPSNALQLRISKLRKLVGAVLVRQPPGYRLDVDLEQVDAVRFARLVADRRFVEALGLWRGPPLGEFADQEWARAEATRLAELQATAVEEHVDVRLAAGLHVELVPELEALVAADPLRERRRGQLMLALYRCGRSAEALAAYQHFRRHLDGELGLEPSETLRRLEAAILRQDASLAGPSAVSRPSSNLPVPLSSLVGRENELRRIPEFLNRSRLLTLVGPGGAGKTRLAIAAARQITRDQRDSVWFVPLAGVTDPARIPAAVADAVGVSDPDGASIGQLVTAWFAPRAALLVLDNCEHLADASAVFVERLLQASARLRIIATSREALGVQGEIQMPVPPLPEPDAVTLFAERATSVRPDFDPESAAPAVRRICERLDGMPLAIELAAARVKTLTPDEIAARLEDRFALLTTGPRTAEARHRTLRATVDWSHELLSEQERALLRRLAVFEGGWTLEAAEAVCADNEAADILDLVTRLVDRSLVVADNGRFGMLETIRAYAAARLTEAGEHDVMRERHARYYTAVAQRIEPALRGPDQGSWLRLLRADDANLRRALEWARGRADSDPDLALQLAAALGWYWYVGRQVDGHPQLVATLTAARGGTPADRAGALQALSLAARPAGCIVHPSTEAAEAARESQVLFCQAGEPARAGLSQLLVAVQGVTGGDVPHALAMVSDARDTLRAHDDAWGVALADFVEMEIRLHNGPVDDALPFGDEAARQFDALRDDWGRSAVRLHLGYGLRLAGRTDDAEQALDKAVALSREAGLPNNLGRSLVELGEAALHRGAADDAERWFAEAEQVARELANDSLLALVALGRGTAARLRRDPEAGRRRYGEALDLSGAADVPRGVARARAGLAAVDLDGGDTAAAEEHLGQAMTVATVIQDAGVTATVLEQRARAAMAAGDGERRKRLLDEASALRVRHGRPPGALEARDVEGTLVPSHTAD